MFLVRGDNNLLRGLMVFTSGFKEPSSPALILCRSKGHGKGTETDTCAQRCFSSQQKVGAALCLYKRYKPYSVRDILMCWSQASSRLMEINVTALCQHWHFSELILKVFSAPHGQKYSNLLFHVLSAKMQRLHFWQTVSVDDVFPPVIIKLLLQQGCVLSSLRYPCQMKHRQNGDLINCHNCCITNLVLKRTPELN